MIVAPMEIRFKRMVEKRRIGDQNKMQGFREQEKKDLGINQESHGQQNSICFSMAQKGIMNDGSLDDLRNKAEELIRKLGL